MQLSRLLKTVTIIFTISLAVSAYGSSELPTAAEKLVSRTPDSTFTFITTSGMEQLRPAFDQSSMGQLWNTPELQTFITQIKQSVLAKVQKEMSASGVNDAQMISSAVKFAETAIQCPMIAGLSECPADPNSKMPFRFFFVLEAGKYKQEIQVLIDQFEKALGKEQIIDKSIGSLIFHAPKAEGDFPAFWGWYRNTFIIFVNDPKGEMLSGLRSSSIKPSPLSKLAGNGDLLAFHYNIDKSNSMISGFTDKSEKADLIDGVKIFRKLGLSSVKSVTARAGFSRKDMIIEHWVESPAPHAGLFKALKPLDMAMLDKSDARATTVAAWNVDLGMIYDIIADALGTQNTAQPSGTDPIAEASSLFQKLDSFGNIKIRDGFLKSLDGQMSVFVYPAMTFPESPLMGLAFCAKLSDSKLFTQNMQAVETELIAKLGSQALQIKPKALADGGSATMWIMPQIAMSQIVPNWTIVDNYLVITSHPVITETAIKQMKASKPQDTSIRSSMALKMLESKLPAGTFYFQYNNTAENAKQMMTQAQQFWPMLAGMASAQGVTLPASLPNITPQIETLGVSTQHAWMDTDGLHLRYQGSGLEASAGTVAGGAMGLAILMPALSKTKTVAQRTLSMTNMKSVGIACAVCAEDNDGKFPAKLEDLIEKADLSPKSLISPRKPDDFKGPSYVYIEGQTVKSPIDNILAYEQPSFAKDGKINVLFVDGHVEAMSPADFQTALERTYKNLNRPMPNQTTSIIEPAKNQ